MLLRSSSTPILNSYFPQTKAWHLEPNQLHQLQRTKSLSLTTSFHHDKKINQNLFFESDLTNPTSMIPVPESCKIQKVFLSSGLGGKVVNYDDECNEKKNECVLQTLVMGGGMGNNGGRICCGGGGGSNSGGGGGDDDNSEFFENNNHHGSNITDVYYQNMIKANPGIALILGNYAKFLKEVRGDLVKAEEYCGKAILADPDDGYVLSLYGDIIWHLEKDAQRADTYFHQAVETSPDDCFLLASYAQFLWNIKDEEEEEDKADDYETEEIHRSPPGFSHGASHHTPLTATS